MVKNDPHKRSVIGLKCAALALAALLAQSCASVMTEEECLSADWREVGRNDGLYGQPGEKFEERAERCQKFGVVADFDAYAIGREAGLASYCTPLSGFEEGRSGRRYQNVCPLETERDFLAEYDLGRELYQLTQDYERATRAYETTLGSIDNQRRKLRRARNRYNENTLSDDERAELRADIDHYRRELRTLEDKIPSLLYDMDRARDRLDDYRSFLRRSGRL